MWWLYGLVAIAVWRNAAGFIAWSMARSYNQKSLDGEDISLGIFFGFFCGACWPLWLVYRAGDYAHHRWIKESDFKYTFWIPQPKVIESKQEEEKRKVVERNNNIEEYQRKVNSHERENGLPLTRWEF